MNRTGPKEEIARAVAEAVTGARATTERSVIEERDQITTLILDWDGCPGGYELPGRVNIRVGPYGDYDARFEAVSKPFASGLTQDTLMTPATVLIGVRVRVTDPETFRGAMGLTEQTEISAADLEAAMLRLPVDAAEAGIDRIRVSDVLSSQADLYFEVSAEVSDMGRLVGAAREAYLEAWWDNTWIPGSPNEALFELALGSNANPSPDEMGFEFVEFPDTRHQSALRAAADREVALSPSLVPDAPLPYSDWLELTGRDDSFVGNGLDVPGTRDLYGAALRALPRPDPSGPEPD
jgi:hypothetical protein